jgi:hypothetical protein
MKEPRPRWIRCADCEEYFCRVHQQHVFECPCPSVDEKAAEGVDPFDYYYGTEGP